MIGLSRSLPGRYVLARALNYYIWPPVYWLARAWRGTVLSRNRIIAVTGSFGKTSTTMAIAAALGGCRYSLDYNHTCYLASRLLRLRPGRGQTIFEVGVSKGPGFMAQQVKMLRPEVVVVTTIGSEHSTAFATLEDTRREKFELVSSLGAGGLAVLNGDEEHVRWMAGRAPCRVIQFGYGEHNQVRADQVQAQWPHGTRFRLHIGGRQYEARVRFLGKHNLRNILAAVAVAEQQGVPVELILARLAELPPVQARMQPVELAGGAWLLRDDFKATPETVYEALEYLKGLDVPRKVVVIGNLSEQWVNPIQAHVELGEMVGSIADRVLYMGTNFQKFKKGVRQGGLDPKRFTHCHQSVKTAVEILESEMAPGDVILLKGRGDQKFERIAMSLMGRKVACDLTSCNSNLLRCEKCNKLATGWPAGVTKI